MHAYTCVRILIRFGNREKSVDASGEKSTFAIYSAVFSLDIFLHTCLPVSRVAKIFHYYHCIIFFERSLRHVAS